MLALALADGAAATLAELARAMHLNAAGRASDARRRAAISRALHGLLHLQLGGALAGSFLRVRRAALAHACALVPAGLRAHPLAAHRALLEVRHRLVHRLLVRGVALLAAQSAIDVLGGAARPVAEAREDREYIQRRLQQVGARPHILTLVAVRARVTA